MVVVAVVVVVAAVGVGLSRYIGMWHIKSNLSVNTIE